MGSDLSAAVVAGGVSLFTVGLREVLDWRRRSRHDKRQIQVAYLRPLKRACRELVKRFYDIKAKASAGEKIDSKFQELTNLANGKEGVFHHRCNDDMSWYANALYHTAVYLGCAGRVRSQLPLPELPPALSDGLERAMDAVREGLGGRYGLWQDHQDVIGQLVLEENEIVSYPRFLHKLLAEREPFKQLFFFYCGIEAKLETEVERGCVGLENLNKELDETLKAARAR